jgi:pimeloyl-ACP methyl ester carboxylesterase
MNKVMLRCIQASFCIAFAALAAPNYLQQSDSWRDASPHTVRFVAVEQNVRLEVLDWGGTGKPVVLLAGGGFTAHVFDDLAPKLTTDHHVYGITRRGFGASGFSPSENPVDRLRDDVLAIIDALNLERPVLVGHSIAGAELSAVASSHPDRIAGLVYLEAGYPYAFDNGEGPRMKEFQTSGPPSGPRPPHPGASDLASFSALQKWDAEVHGVRIPEAELRQRWESDLLGRPRKERDFPGSQLFVAILTSTKTYTHIPVPALIIFASPHVPGNPALDAATERQAKALERGVPTARVVRLRGAHFIFLSNEPDTLREMRAFLAGLK